MRNLQDKITLRSDMIQFSFLNSGDIGKVTNKNIMINQMISNVIDGSMNNIYLRIYDEGTIEVVPLLGVNSDSTFSISDTQVSWRGSIKDINYSVTLTLLNHIWFWEVKLEGEHKLVDIIYGQDLGMADEGAIRNNEAYVSQYVDHKVFNDEERGFIVCSRQNQPQSTGFPYLQQGSLTKTIGYSTDGFQFFGKSYKETNNPEALTKPLLANENYQYEFAYTALQTEKTELHGTRHFVFYGLYKENHQEAITSLEYQTEVNEAWAKVKALQSTFTIVEKVKISSSIGAPMQTESLSLEEINLLYPERIHEEWHNNKLLAFFTPSHEHIVLKEKELLVERPHGHILMRGNNVENMEEVITTTSYMFGVFNSQLVVGNTSMNKFISNTRNALNVIKTSGQRIYVKINEQFRLLTMPSLFEIGFNCVRWYYKTAEETFIISNFTTVDSNEVHLHVSSLSGKKYRYLVTNQVTMNGNEYQSPFEMQVDGNVLFFKSGEHSDNKNICPNLGYRLQISGASFHVYDETILSQSVLKNSASLVVLNIDDTNSWKMTVQGSINGIFTPIKPTDEKVEIDQYRKFLSKTMNGFNLKLGEQTPDTVEKFNTLAWWYTHNMLVHYSVPHGLEQYGGAAWGTRDVCQGPVEYFMATQQFKVVRKILLTVFSNQNFDDGNWPQWFMFDEYKHIRAGESHGDIIVWPLKVLSDYLLASGDYQILEEKVPYMNRSTSQFTEEKESIFAHVQKEINYIKEHFLHDTHLSSYGDGDWDDTLQPANAQLKQYMASSWTVALTYQAIKQYAEALEKNNKYDAENLHLLADNIKNDFHRYLMPKDTDIVPGFLYLESPEKPEKMLHPEDTKTGIQYRLLPMQQSIISEVFNLEEAKRHYKIIREHLYFPDGVRLMNRPSTYSGGVSKHFKRAEQASNFGREIGLQYVHAHIRFVEAMAKLGDAEEAWRGLEVINPVNIRTAVTNADFRQSNCYFSSSDGKFKTRYEAQEQFGKLRTGEVQVKAGWRIYSSGPGIYMNQLISNVLGIRFFNENLIIDPVLPDNLNGLHFNFKINKKPVTFIYHINGNNEKAVVVNGQLQTTREYNNIYRNNGFMLSMKDLDQKLNEENNVIEIYI